MTPEQVEETARKWQPLRDVIDAACTCESAGDCGACKAWALVVALADDNRTLQAEVERLKGKLDEENTTNCEQEQILRDKAAHFKAKLDKMREALEAWVKEWDSGKLVCQPHLIVNSRAALADGEEPEIDLSS